MSYSDDTYEFYRNGPPVQGWPQKVVMFDRLVTDAYVVGHDRDGSPQRGRWLIPQEVRILNDLIYERRISVVGPLPDLAGTGAEQTEVRKAGLHLGVTAVRVCAVCGGDLSIWEAAGNEPVHGACWRR